MPKLLLGNVRHLSLVSCRSIFSLLLDLPSAYTHVYVWTHTHSLCCGHYVSTPFRTPHLLRTPGQLPLLPLTALNLSSLILSRDWLCLRIPIPCSFATQFSRMSKMITGFLFISLFPGLASFQVVLGLPHPWVSALLPTFRLCHRHSFHRVHFSPALHLNLNWKAHGFLSFPNAYST